MPFNRIGYDIIRNFEQQIRLDQIFLKTTKNGPDADPPHRLHLFGPLVQVRVSSYMDNLLQLFNHKYVHNAF